MRFMNSFNKFAGKWMPVIVLVCLSIGITFSESIGRLTFLVPYIFAFMTFTGTLNSGFRQLLNIAKHPVSLIVSLLLIHIAMPLLALGIGKLCFPANPYFIVGMVLEFVVPSAVASFLWSSMAGGNASLTLSIVLIDTLTAPFLVPFSLHLLVGARVSVDVAGMMRDLIWMIAVPALATMLLNQFTKGEAGKKLSPVLAPYGKIALILIIMINSTRIAPFIRHMTPILYEVTGCIFVIAVLGYLAGWFAGFLLKQKSDITSSMTFGCGMRNISAGAVIAAAYFPAEVMFPVMIATLFQQVLASVFARLLNRNKERQ
ncbi:MAG TPA: bile acid:sodium symporter family protein [Caproicibacter sp.]|nr:bile acid:sodium symporter family protein [Caproicibacter sp.]